MTRVLQGKETISRSPNKKAHRKNIEALQQYVSNFTENTEPSFFAAELKIQELVNNIQRDALEQCAQKYDIDVPAIQIQDQIYRKVLRESSTYQSSSGPIEIIRSLYSTRKKDDKSICPFELKAGIIDGFWSPLSARKSIWASSHLTPRESEEMFVELGQMKPSKSTIDRLSKTLGGCWEQDLHKHHQILALEQDVNPEAVTVSISLDGVMVPMVGGANESTGYKEASCGSVSLYDEDGERLSTVQFGRMPEYKKSTLKQLIEDELKALKAVNPELQVVKIADGAKDNWDFLDNEIKEGVSLLDFWHMSEHMKEGFDAAYPNEPVKSASTYAKYKSILQNDPDGANKLIRCLKRLSDKHPRRKILATTLNYMKSNRDRMWYSLALDKNLPIGSGVVEATCKTLVAERLKKSGMKWKTEGGQAVLNFRALIKSKRFDVAWAMISSKYIQECRMPDKVSSIADRRSKC